MGQLQPIPAHPAIDPANVLTHVENALEALQKAFRTTDETPKQERADADYIPQQPAEDQASQT